MKKVPLLNIEGKKVGDVELPEHFEAEYRPDLIKRAVLAIQNNRRQPYGAMPNAGKRASSRLSKRRRSYRTCYGRGISRTPRKILSRRGLNFIFVGAVAPNTVGGRRAHPPKAEKIWDQKINKKERKKAILSAIAATAIKEVVKKRGHKVECELPIIIESEFENIKKTKNVKDILIKLGLEKELERISKKKVRAGKGKMRGRRYKKKKGPLIVVSDKCNLMKAASNIPGIDVVNVRLLNAELLAPGCMAGRLTIWTDKAIKALEKEKLFLEK